MDEFRRRFRKINTFDRHRDLARLQREMERLADDHPGRAEPYFAIAQAALQSGQVDLGREMLDRGLERAPHHPDGLLIKSMMAIEDRRHGLAIRALKKANRKSSKPAIVQYHLGLAYRAKGKTRAARKAFERALEIDSTYAHAHLELGVIQAETGETIEAGVSIERAIKYQPDLEKAHLALARIRAAQGDRKAAIKTLRRGLARATTSLSLHNALIDFLFLDGQADQALTAARKMAQTNPSYPAFLKLGFVAMSAKDADQARRALNEAIKIDPDAWEAYYNLGELHFATGQFGAARQGYQEAINRKPNQFEPHNGLGLLFIHNGSDPQLAEKSLLTAMNLAPKRPEPRLNLALLYARTGNVRKARQFARQALKLASSGDSVHQQAVRLLARLDA